MKKQNVIPLVGLKEQESRQLNIPSNIIIFTQYAKSICHSYMKSPFIK